MNSNIDEMVKSFKDREAEFWYFQSRLINEFKENPDVKDFVHSVKSRIKDLDHLKEKIIRKNNSLEESGEEKITSENLFNKITDFSGIRVLHLHLGQFEAIHNFIVNLRDNGEFVEYEPCKAYTWDHESESFFKELGIETKLKDSYYTSVHYVLKPSKDSIITCEIQVRTLLEEVWGEIDHSMNYPKPHSDSHCQSQLKVLARLIGACGHLSNSIMRQYHD